MNRAVLVTGALLVAVGLGVFGAKVLSNAFSIAASTSSGTALRMRRTEGIGSAKVLAMTACAVGPVYGASPASIS